MTPIKIGQIGVCHEHAAAKMKSLRAMTGIYEVVGVVGDCNSPAAKFPSPDTSPYHGLPWISEDELFAIPGLQAVVVETPNLQLVPTSIRCLERGLAIHMDKPGGDNLELFSRLLKGCQARRIPFQMGYMFRGNPAMQWCIKAVRQGWLGDIFEIHGSMNHNYGGQDYQEYLGQFSGGIMFNLGCHLIDLVVAMLGRPGRVIPFLQSVPGFSAQIKNNCLAVLEYDHATAVLRACSLDADGLSRRRFRICGTKGTAELCPLERFDGRPLTMDLTLLEGNEQFADGTHVVDFGLLHDRYQEQFLELAGLINGELKTAYNTEHDYLVQEVLLAAAGYRQWQG